MTVPFAEIDLRVGGRFRIEMEEPGGQRQCAVGTYLEIDPPKRLVYSWAWEPELYDSRVTVEFVDRGAAGTEVVIRHERLRNEQERSNHEEGWVGCLAKLGDVLAMER